MNSLPPFSQSISSRRVVALERSGLLDSVGEPEFDRITRLACRLLGLQTALLSLVDADRQFFKSSCGLPEPWKSERQTPLTHSFCQYVVAFDRPLVIADATKDPLVAENLAVTELGVVSYLGVPVRSPDGQVLGALCAIGTEPRDWSQDDQELIKDLAAIVENEIGLREHARRAKALAEANAVLAHEYHHRVKNALAVAASLVALSGREAASPGEVVDIARARLQALASAHDALIAKGDEVELKLLAQRLLRPYCSPGATAEIEGPPVSLVPQQVTPICLFLHELATNSAKYGAFCSQGHVDVRWERLGGSDIALRWDERSPSILKAGECGFGSQLLAIVTKQLGGELRTEWLHEHLRVSLEFPVGRQVPA